MTANYERVEIRSRPEWRDWLRTHHDRSSGVWLVTFHKSVPRWHVPYSEVVDEAIAFGWVDSQPRTLDDQRSQLLVTPRRPTSSWSRANKQRVERLERAGLMTEAGRRAVALAQANGAWTALDQVEQLVEPDDLQVALLRHAGARENWDGFPRSAKRAILEWIASAKKPETRGRRITETARLAADDIRANQPRQPQRRRPSSR